MRILVCCKQVPDTAEVRIDPETHTLVRHGIPSILNPYDLHALEEGLRWGARAGGETVAMSMGPPQAEAVLREALARGATRAVLLCDRAFAGADTWATSLTLAAAARRVEPDLILCGKQAIDGDTAQVGPGLAAHLNMPQLCYVRRILEMTGDVLVAERLLDHGMETVRVPLPGVLTVVREINEPRLPTLPGKRRGWRGAVEVWGAADLGLPEGETGLEGSPTSVDAIASPPPREGGVRFSGTPEKMARALVDALGGEGLL